MATLNAKEQGTRSLWTHSLSMKVIGEEVVSWKRRVESFVTSQSPFVKITLSIIAILGCTYGGLSLAQTLESDPSASTGFEVYRSIRMAEAAVKGNPALPAEESQVLVAIGLDTADDYIREIFGTPVPEKIPAAEVAVRQPLASPLPDIDNGAPPLPGTEIAVGRSAGVASRALLWPMRGGYVSSRFGMRWGRMHQGTDIAAPHGTPILAAADGKVIFSGWEGGYGQLVIVDHGNGVKTKYGHCSKLLVSVGERVQQGDIIGKVGSTGHSTGPHLHYEVLREGQASNPESFTRRR